jgi:PKD repeat protein
MPYPRFLLRPRASAQGGLLYCLLAALLLAGAGTGTVAGLDWESETVDAGGGSPSLALDAAGNPHVSYAGGGLKYAAFNGTGWEVRAVDPAASAGPSSLVLDAAGAPRSAYFDTAAHDLRYAAWDGVVWRLETVDPDGTAGGRPSLALDGAGNPRIGYVVGGATRTVRYAALDGPAWRVETVDQPGPSSWGTSLVLDGSRLPSIGYGDGDRVKRATHNGTAWRVETPGQAWPGDPGAAPALVLDRAGTPRIAVSDPSTHALFYRAWDGSGWRTEWVGENGDVMQHASLALDAAGTPGISYFALRTYPAFAASGFRYAGYNRSSRQWETGTVDDSDLFAGHFSSLALDSAGNPRIAYDSTTGLKVARADAPGPTVRFVPGGSGHPSATGGDGLYDDVNGNGRPDFTDGVLYVNQMSWSAANEPTAAFDYNANGRIDFADVVRLFDRLDAPARRTFTVTADAIGPGIIQPSGHLPVREGEDITFTLHVGPGVPLPHATQSGVIIGNEVVVDPAAIPTLHPDGGGGYPGSTTFTSSFTLSDVRADHAVYGVFYRAGWITC